MTIVFTNGVFDIIHGGHISLLKYAHSLGDKLIVGINSDDSVRRLKGPDRPIQNQITRSIVLLEMRCVDQVVIFDQDTPEDIIKRIQPNILVKGPEAANSLVPGAEFVISHGGKIIIPNWPIKESTTQIINKIIKSYERV